MTATNDENSLPVEVQIDRLLEEGWYLSRRHLQGAADDANQALLLARPLTNKGPLVDTLCLLSAVENLRANFAAARAAADEARELLPALCERRIEREAHTLHRIALVEMSLGSYDTALELLAAVQEKARLAGNTRREIDALCETGQCHHRRGDFRRALEIQEECRQRSIAADYPFGEAVANNRLAAAYDRFGDYSTALEKYRAALSYWQEIEDRIGEVISIGNIGNIYLMLKEPEPSLMYHLRGIAIARQCGAPVYEASGLGNLALAYFIQKDYQEAENYHRQALRLKEQMGDRHAVANTLSNLGEILGLQHRYTEAFACLEEGLRLTCEMEDVHGQTHCLYRLVSTAIQEAKTSGASPQDPAFFERCYPWVEECLRLSEQIGTAQLKYSTHNVLSEFYRYLGDLEKALFHYEQFHDHYVTVYTEETARKTRLMQTLHSVEQAKQEAEIHRLRTIELAAALEEAERQRRIAEIQAQHDGLTGLTNRAYAEVRLQEEYERAVRYYHPFTVALADADDFKRINDLYSHAVGDQVLCRLAQLLRDSCREFDIVARYGGEEFVLGFVEASVTKALPLCERIRVAVETYPWATVAPGLRVTLSIGVCSDLTLLSAEKMLSVADQRLYRAKRNGRNQIQADIDDESLKSRLAENATAPDRMSSLSHKRRPEEGRQ